MSSNNFNTLIAAAAVATTHPVSALVASAGVSTTAAAAVHGAAAQLAVNLATAEHNELETVSHTAMPQWLATQVPRAAQRDVAASANNVDVQTDLVPTTAITGLTPSSSGPSDGGTATIAAQYNPARAPVAIHADSTVAPARAHSAFPRGLANVAPISVQVLLGPSVFPARMPVPSHITPADASTSLHTTQHRHPMLGQQRAQSYSAANAARKCSTLPFVARAATASSPPVVANTGQSERPRAHGRKRDLLTANERKELRKLDRLVEEKPKFMAWAKDPKDPFVAAEAHTVINKYATDFYPVPRVDNRPPSLWSAVKSAATCFLKRKRDDDVYDVGPLVKRARTQRQRGLSEYKRSGKKTTGGRRSGFVKVAAMFAPLISGADEVPMDTINEVVSVQSDSSIKTIVPQTTRAILTVPETARQIFHHHVSNLPRQAQKPVPTAIINALLGVTAAVGLTRTKRKRVRFAPYHTYLGPHRRIIPPLPEPIEEDGFGSDIAEHGSDSEKEESSSDFNYDSQSESDSKSGDDAGHRWPDVHLSSGYAEDEAVASSSAPPITLSSATHTASSAPTVSHFSDMPPSSALPSVTSHPGSGDKDMHHV